MALNSILQVFIVAKEVRNKNGSVYERDRFSSGSNGSRVDAAIASYRSAAARDRKANDRAKQSEEISKP